jgi:hypothetical protein
MIQLIVKSCSHALVLHTGYEAVFFISSIEEIILSTLKDVHKGQHLYCWPSLFAIPQAED